MAEGHGAGQGRLEGKAGSAPGTLWLCSALSLQSSFVLEVSLCQAARKTQGAPLDLNFRYTTIIGVV